MSTVIEKIPYRFPSQPELDALSDKELVEKMRTLVRKRYKQILTELRKNEHFIESIHYDEDIRQYDWKFMEYVDRAINDRVARYFAEGKQRLDAGAALAEAHGYTGRGIETGLRFNFDTTLYYNAGNSGWSSSRC